jgi:SAM-dependent methyltransferase
MSTTSAVKATNASSPDLDSFAALRRPYACCPACDSTRMTLLGVAPVTNYVNWHDRLPPTLDWMRCDDCAHVFTRHWWTAEGLSEVFRRSHAGQVAGGDPDHKRHVWKPTVLAAVELLGGYRAAIGARPEAPPLWLDAGCGDGALVMTASEMGFNAIGLDARQEAVEALVRTGYRAQQGDFMALTDDVSVDVLSLCDVLEHLPFPQEALARARRLVRPGGLIVISLPNMDSSSWRLMDQAGSNPYWIEIEHHHNFTRASLSRLVEQAGFSVERMDLTFRYKAQMEIMARAA